MSVTTIKGFEALHNPSISERLKKLIKAHNDEVERLTQRIVVAVAVPKDPPLRRIVTPRMREIDEIINRLETAEERLRSTSARWAATLPQRIELRRQIQSLDAEWNHLDQEVNR